MRRLLISAIVGVTAVASTGMPAPAQTFDSGSTGTDGAFMPTADVTLTLPPDGTLQFTTVSVPAGVTVTFARNATNTPVTILATGDVTIAGTIDVSGARGGRGSPSGTVVAPNRGLAGPGGFDGGNGANGIASNVGGAGLGPGGGSGGRPLFGGGGGYATRGGDGWPWDRGGPGGPTYGSPALLPLIGGSGGGGGGGDFGQTGAGGGGGGGAIVIAASGTLTLTGQILARGGDAGGVNPEMPGGGGSGGAIRLVATAITGTGGKLDVAGGNHETSFNMGGNRGGAGRIRVEAYTNTATTNFSGVIPSIAQPTSIALPTGASLRIASVAGVSAPATPAASLSAPDITLPGGIASPVDVVVTAAHVPVGTAVTVIVKGLTGPASQASGMLSGTAAASSATVGVAIPTNQPAVVSASVTYTLTAAGNGPAFVDGEMVERVRVTATPGGAARVAYLTRSGREIVSAAGPVVR
jgi:hypothetical protein